MLRAVCAAVAGGTLVAGVQGYRSTAALEGQLTEAAQTTLHSPFPAVAGADASPSAAPAKRAIVIGAGVVGLATAERLRRRGFKVHILDASRDGVANECSSATAGGMSRSNHRQDKGAWQSTIKSFLAQLNPFADPDEFQFFRLRMRSVADPHFWRWLAHFSRSTLLTRAEANEEAGKQLLDFTVFAVEAIVADMQAQGGQLARAASLSDTGQLNLSFGSMSGAYNHQNEAEPAEWLDRDAVFKLEPWLASSAVAERISGAKHQPAVRRGICAAFARALADNMVATSNVVISSDTRVLGFRRRGGVVSEVITSQGRLAVDPGTAVVVAAGSHSPCLLRRLGLWVPLYPLKGYTVLVDIRNLPSDVPLPGRIVVDDFVYVCPYPEAGELRCSSMGEFDGWNTEPRPDVAEHMRMKCSQLLPGMATTVARAPVVAGLRPQVADAVPLVGRVPGYVNLFLNAGPGSNGWKLSMGMGELLAAEIDGDSSPAARVADRRLLGLAGRVLESPIFCALCEAFGPKD